MYYIYSINIIYIIYYKKNVFFILCSIIYIYNRINSNYYILDIYLYYIIYIYSKNSVYIYILFYII